MNIFPLEKRKIKKTNYLPIDVFGFFFVQYCYTLMVTYCMFVLNSEMTNNKFIFFHDAFHETLLTCGT